MTELIMQIVDSDKDQAVIEKIIEKEITADLEQRKSELVLKVFEVVEKFNLDPWNIDLDKFTSIFINEINENFRDLPVAGKIIYLAWVNIRSKSDLLIPPPEVEDDSVEDPLFVDEQPSEEAPISIDYLPVEKRSVTVDDIVNAIRNTPLNFIKNSVRKAKKIIFQETAHPEDLHAIISEVWSRMVAHNVDHFSMESLVRGGADDFIDVFQSSLFLAFYGRIYLNQEMPYGDIWVSVLSKERDTLPVPEIKPDQDEFII
ncbi:MAG: hypothetical protein QXN66_04055 [Thermoplasmatales archaeon]